MIGGQWETRARELETRLREMDAERERLLIERDGVRVIAEQADLYRDAAEARVRELERTAKQALAELDGSEAELADLRGRVSAFLSAWHGADGGDTDEEINAAIDALIGA